MSDLGWHRWIADCGNYGSGRGVSCAFYIFFIRDGILFCCMASKKGAAGCRNSKFKSRGNEHGYIQETDEPFSSLNCSKGFIALPTQDRREAFVEGLLARLPIISFDAIAALRRACSGWNGGRFSHDLIIAAAALTKGYIVTTRDERSFPRISGLSHQRW